MPEVAVVTDTTHYLPGALVAERGVHEVSLYVNDGNGQEREADISDLDAFYDGLRAAASLPTTSQPSIGDFLAVYEPLVAEVHVQRHLVDVVRLQELPRRVVRGVGDQGDPGHVGSLRLRGSWQDGPQWARPW